VFILEENVFFSKLALYFYFDLCYNTNMIPVYVKPFLWSYDTKRIDIGKDKRTIILNVLNLGTKKSIDWLLNNYTKEEIRQVIKNTYKSEWDNKSINLWSMVFNVKPKKQRNVALRNIRQKKN
jgi:hypothetical protein